MDAKTMAALPEKQRQIAEAMLVHPKFLKSDHVWLGNLITGYLANGYLSMAQRNTMDTLLKICGIREPAGQLFPPLGTGTVRTVRTEAPVQSRPKQEKDPHAILADAERKAKAMKAKKAKPKFKPRGFKR